MCGYNFCKLKNKISHCSLYLFLQLNWVVVLNLAGSLVFLVTELRGLDIHSKEVVESEGEERYVWNTTTPSVVWKWSKRSRKGFSAAEIMEYAIQTIAEV